MDSTTAIKHIIDLEGGLVDHPKDPGGITKYGISLRAYPELGASGIRALTKDDAAEIYKRDYWDATRCDELPSGLRLMVFDCAVNQGVGYASKALQASVGARADGQLGPNTMKAVNSVNVVTAVQRMATNRFTRYQSNRNWGTFGKGWMSRLLHVTALTLT